MKDDAEKAKAVQECADTIEELNLMLKNYGPIFSDREKSALVRAKEICTIAACALLSACTSMPPAAPEPPRCLISFNDRCMVCERPTTGWQEFSPTGPMQ